MNTGAFANQALVQGVPVQDLIKMAMVVTRRIKFTNKAESTRQHQMTSSALKTKDTTLNI
jgi:hypothetical protein